MINPLRDHANNLSGFVKIIRGVSKHRVTTDALRRSEEGFRLLAKSAKDCAVFLLDPQGLVISWNVGAECINGYRPDEIIGRDYSVFFTDADRDSGEPARALEIATRDGRFEVQGLRLRSNGEVFPADVVITPIRRDNGTIIGFTKMTRDLSQATRGQLELEHTGRALFQSQKMEAVGQLTGGIARDFNNFLMGILDGLELVQRRVANDPGITPLLENAVQLARKGRTLAKSMLAFSRRQELFPENVDVMQILLGMRDLFQRGSGSSIGIKIQCSGDLEAVQVDQNQLKLTIVNLLLNARDAMPDGGIICLDAREEAVWSHQGDAAKPDRFICISVTDHGTGMDAGDFFVSDRRLLYNQGCWQRYRSWLVGGTGLRRGVRRALRHQKPGGRRYCRGNLVARAGRSPCGGCSDRRSGDR